MGRGPSAALKLRRTFLAKTFHTFHTVFGAGGKGAGHAFQSGGAVFAAAGIDKLFGELQGHRGLARHVPPEIWQTMVVQMGASFRAGRHEEGLTQALSEVSALLVQHFPSGTGPDSSEARDNELPDHPVIGRK